MNRGRSSQASLKSRQRSRSRSVARKGSSSAKMKTHDEHGNMIDDEAINTFISALDALPKDEWRARTLAFEALVENLPEPGSAPVVRSGITPWYKSYTALRRIEKPIASLLLNPRSTVVKHTSQHLGILVQRVKEVNTANTDMCKYLLKDLLPTILAMHGQTTKSIRTYALEMMIIVIPLCRFKSGLPLLLERLRKDKSRDVREGCVCYLGMITQHWSPESGTNSSDKEYLTKNICMHIGNGLARALMDPAQNVRTEAKKSFEVFRHHYPELWNEIVQKPGGILSKDARLKKSIMNAAIKSDSGMSGNTEDSYSAYEDGEDYDTKTLGSMGSRNSINSWNSTSSFVSKSSKPSLRSNARSGSRNRGTRGPAMRSTNGSLPPVRTNARSGITSSRVTRGGPFGNLASPDRNSAQKKANGHSNGVISSITLKTDENQEDNMPSVPVLNQKLLSLTSDERSTISKKPSENYKVSNQLLAAHKLYIDDLMESLRTEMNTVRDFETLLVKSQNNPDEDGTYGPSEDAVLKYYEAVYAYLDAGADNAAKLRNEMERISKS